MNYQVKHERTCLPASSQDAPLNPWHAPPLYYPPYECLYCTLLYHYTMYCTVRSSVAMDTIGKVCKQKKRAETGRQRPIPHGNKNAIVGYRVPSILRTEFDNFDGGCMGGACSNAITVNETDCSQVSALYGPSNTPRTHAGTGRPSRD